MGSLPGVNGSLAMGNLTTFDYEAYGVGGTPIYSQFSPGQDLYGTGNACGNTAAVYRLARIGRERLV
jgi:hypothetical protein